MLDLNADSMDLKPAALRTVIPERRESHSSATSGSTHSTLALGLSSDDGPEDRCRCGGAGRGLALIVMMLN